MSDLTRLDEALAHETRIANQLGDGLSYAAMQAIGDAARAYRDLANGKRVASYRDTDGFVKLHGSTMLDERGPGALYLVIPIDVNLDSGGQTQVSESKLANEERVEPDYEAATQAYLDDDMHGDLDLIALCAKKVVDAAIGDKLLIDYPKEELHDL